MEEERKGRRRRDGRMKESMERPTLAELHATLLSLRLVTTTLCVHLCHTYTLTLQHTTMMGKPRLQVRVVSPSGRATLSKSSTEVGTEDSSGST